MWTTLKTTFQFFPCVQLKVLLHKMLMISILVINKIYTGLCDCIPPIYFHILAPVVVSKMPNESVAHRPVEMLPLVCQRDQREVAQLQVRQHAT